ncbi:hypothetical protein [Nonomuraea sediminis]|uniref:hypothetical protein n=1 Tax=Nonomuraea sediminis TaxID=2835864 RepID=UPI001BDBB24B|nr:hypothetical protein [Nonomuraea sediminis]
MKEALLAILGAALGYAGHWGQTWLAQRTEERQAQRDLIAGMRKKLIELREWPAGHDRCRTLIKETAADAGLLVDKRLRERVAEDMRYALRGRTDVWALAPWTFGGDAFECLSARLRGDRRLPGFSPNREMSQFLMDQEPPHAHIDDLARSLMVREDGREVFLAWRARRTKGWRRALPSGFRRGRL